MKNNMKKQIFVKITKNINKIGLLILLLLNLSVYAGTYSWSNYSPTIPSAMITVSDPNWSVNEYPNGAATDFVKRNWYVKLYYGKENRTDILNTNFELKVNYTINFTAIGSLPSISENASLSISYKADATSVITDFSEQIKKHVSASQYKSASVFVTSYVLTSTISPPPVIPSDVHLELKVEAEKYVDMNPFFTQYIDVVYQNNSVVPYWNVVPGAEEYELQYVFIDKNTDGYNDFLSGSSEDPFLFKTPISIITSNNYYEIDPTYGSGALFFRCRAIGRFVNNSLFTSNETFHKRFFDWKYLNNTSTKCIIKFDDVQNLTLSPKVVLEFETNKNWQLVKSYAEDGKNKKVISYFDATSRSRQMVTNLSTGNMSVVAANIYDAEGRPTINVLPVPLPTNDLHFKTDMTVSNLSGLTFDITDFDQITGSNPMKSTTSNINAANYYSSNLITNVYDNAVNRDYIPNANGYPYTQVQYKRDNTGKPTRQSGVGDFHHLFNDEEGISLDWAETRFYYGSPSKEKLNRLFGKNVGIASHYKLNIIEDANGQMSVAYLDQEDRTIATALVGNPPSNPTNLLTLDENQAAEITEDLLANADEDLRARVWTINYPFFNELANKEYVLNALPTVADNCYTCKYRYTLSVQTPNGSYQVDNSTGIPINYSFTFGCDNIYEPALPAFPSDGLFTFNAAVVGEYKIFKKLELLDANISDLITEIESNHLIPTIDELAASYNDEFGDLNRANCNTNCSSFCDQMYPHHATTEPDYNNWISCKNDCDNAVSDAINETIEDGCNSLFINMRNQFLPPSGYYTVVTPPSTHPPGVDLLNNYIASLSAADLAIFKEKFKDNDGNAINPSLINGEFIFETATFINNWADALVQIHPEYCHYTICQLLIESNKYNAKMAIVESSTNADIHEVLKSYFPTTYTSTSPTTARILEIPTYDPFNFTIIPSLLGITLSSKINNYIPEGVSWGGSGTHSLEEYITPLVTNTNHPLYSVLLSGLGASSICNNPLYTSIDVHNLDEVNAQHWRLYKGLYLNEKSKLIETFKATILCNYQDPEDPNTVVKDPTITTSDYYSSSPPTLSTTFYTELDDFYDNICEGNANAWLTNLENHLPATILPLTLTERNDILNILISYCSSKCSMENFGQVHITKDDIINNSYLNSSLGGLTAYINGIFVARCSTCVIPSLYPDNTATTETVDRWMNELTDACSFSGANFLSSSCTSSSGPYSSTDVETCLRSLLENYATINSNILDPSSIVIDFNNVYNQADLIQVELILGNITDCEGKCVSLCSKVVPLEPQYINECNKPKDALRALFSLLNTKINQLHTASFISIPTGSGSVPNASYFRKNIIGQSSTNQITLNHTTQSIAFNNFDPASSSPGYSTCSEFISNNNLVTNEIVFYDRCNNLIHLDNIAKINWSRYNEYTPLPLHTDYLYTKIAVGLSLINLSGPSTCDPSKDIVAYVYVYHFGEYNSTHDDLYKLCPSIADLYENPCESFVLAAIHNDAQIRHQALLDDMIETLRNQRANKCTPTEMLTLKHALLEYHYTLYYYDQAGNLVQTVPPEGVHPLDYIELSYTGNKNSIYTGPNPYHTLLTNYKYNSLNQVLEQTTPDAGMTQFWYNSISQLKFSQNAKQRVYSATKQRFSYTKYDVLGRISSVGELEDNIIPTIDLSLVNLDNIYFPEIKYEYSGAGGYSAYDITKTYYDGYNRYYLFDDINYRGRVNTVWRIENNTDFQYSYTKGVNTYYKYDIEGNVSSLVQSLKGIEDKQIDYDYDLASGKVNAVYYQRNKPDQFIHKYEYDADNRLTNVYTSADGYIYNEDAGYFYYPHGPLARTELGEQKVQGLDYYYTIHGWLKGINMPSQHFPCNDGSPNISYNPEFDPGKDGLNGTLNQYLARDEMALSLGYYEGDYTPIGTTVNLGSLLSSLYNTNSSVRNTILPATSISPNKPKGLYNGNITSMMTEIPKLSQLPSNNTYPTQTMAYQYDQLNRLVNTYSNTYSTDPADNSSCKWNSSDAFQESFTYDQNGNIKTLSRKNNTGTLFDQLSYQYEKNIVGTNTYLVNNKINQVQDLITSGIVSGEILNQTNPNNYIYDAIGNLIKDESENLENIDWDVYGKIKTIKKVEPFSIFTTGGYHTANQQTFTYVYDAMGQRVKKIIDNDIIKSTSGGGTKPGSGGFYSYQQGQMTEMYYIRDASGNIMATYTMEGNPNIATKDQTTDIDYPIYGSSRVGEYHTTQKMSLITKNIWGNIITRNEYIIKTLSIANYYTRVYGAKQYELSNHLGNVLVTISDKRLGQEVGTPNGIAEYYKAEVLTASDYYAFGSLMPGRQYSSGTGYRFGFNTQMKSDEISGSGNHTTAKYWEYDTRIGRRWNLDPVYNASESRYLVNGDNFIYYTDPNGTYKTKFIARLANLFKKGEVKQATERGENGEVNPRAGEYYFMRNGDPDKENGAVEYGPDYGRKPPTTNPLKKALDNIKSNLGLDKLKSKDFAIKAKVNVSIGAQYGIEWVKEKMGIVVNLGSIDVLTIEAQFPGKNERGDGNFFTVTPMMKDGKTNIHGEIEGGWNTIGGKVGYRYTDVQGGVKENTQGVMGVSAFLSAAEATFDKTVYNKMLDLQHIVSGILIDPSGY